MWRIARRPAPASNPQRALTPTARRLPVDRIQPVHTPTAKQSSFIHYATCYCTPSRGYILSFEDAVLTSIRPALAAVIRAVRSSLGLTQEGLAHATSRTYLTKLESGQSTPTLEKFVELASALQISPVALMTLVVATRDGCTPSQLLAAATLELASLNERVRPEDITAHLSGDEILRRPAARPTNVERLLKVQECKSAGLSQAETARQLGVSRSTVNFLWNRTGRNTD